MGRRKGIAREIAEATGLSVRTVQRALSDNVANNPKTAEEQTISRMLKVFRDTATFCRNNPVYTVANLTATTAELDRLQRDFAEVAAWVDVARSTENGDVA